MDLARHVESEGGVVGIVVAGAADLENHAGFALVSERADAGQLLAAVLDMVASGAVARLASDSRQIFTGTCRTTVRKTPGAAVAGDMAAHAPGVVVLVLFL